MLSENLWVKSIKKNSLLTCIKAFIDVVQSNGLLNGVVVREGDAAAIAC
jgi:hypothetical protein